MAKKLIKIFLCSAVVSIVFLLVIVINNTAYALDSNCDGVDDDGDGQCDEDFVVTTPCDGPDDTDSCREGWLHCPKICGVAGVYCVGDGNDSTTENCYDCNIDSDCDGWSDYGDSDCASVDYCAEVPFPQDTSASCVADASNLYGSSCSGGNVVTLSKPGRTCTCGLVCVESTTTTCPFGCEGSWPNASCAGGGGGGNTPPSSSLLATSGEQQAIAGETLTITQGDSVTFDGVIWDCDGLGDIVEKSYNYGTDTEWPQGSDSLGCPDDPTDYLTQSETIVFDFLEQSGDYFISVTDASGAESTSTIQVIVQEEECVCEYDAINGACGQENCGSEDCLETEKCILVNESGCDPGECTKEPYCDATYGDEPGDPCYSEPSLPPIIPKFWREILPKF